MKKLKECPLLVLLFLTCAVVGLLKANGYILKEVRPIERVSASIVGIEEQLDIENFSQEEESLSGNSMAEKGQDELGNAAGESLSENEINKQYEFSAVEEAYFADAVFIGDSRTDGLKDYAKGLGNPVFYSQVGLTIYNLLSEPIVETPEGKISIEEALTQNKFKKIYLMVGINELGRGTVEAFFEEYKKVVTRIQQLQPDAIIFIEAIMKVSEEKSETDAVFNNINITARNEAIKTLENKNNIFYLDMNEAVTDENGNLRAEYSFDGVHLKVIYYKLWEEYLKQNGIIL